MTTYQTQWRNTWGKIQSQMRSDGTISSSLLALSIWGCGCWYFCLFQLFFFFFCLTCVTDQSGWAGGPAFPSVPACRNASLQRGRNDLGLQHLAVPCGTVRRQIKSLCAWWVLLLSPSQKEYFNFTARVSFVNPSPPALRAFSFSPVSKKIQTAGYIWLISSRQICSLIMFKEPFFPWGFLGLVI